MNKQKDFSILNCNRCENCNDYISCPCRVMELNGRKIQYNLLADAPAVIGIYSGDISKHNRDIVDMLAKFHDISLTYFDQRMSNRHTITGINLDKVPVGVMVNIINLLEK